MTSERTHSQIINELHKIERDRNVKILHAVESGSRAWGFPSKNSDYDVRFVYVRPTRSYLSLAARRDVIDQHDLNVTDAQIDLSGWDVLKFLDLASTSNSQVLEWLSVGNSYHTGSLWLALTEIMKQFNLRKVMHSYAGQAKKVWQEQGRGRSDIAVDFACMSMKKYLYVIRCLMMCMVIDRYKDFPDTINLLGMLERAHQWTELNPIRERLKQCISERRFGPEDFVVKPVKEFDEFIEEWMTRVYDMAQAADDTRNPNMMALEQLSYQMVKSYNDG